MNNSPNNERLSSIDFLRGLMIVLMTIDHVRDMFHSVEIGQYIPTDAGVFLYATRWITHLCAPTFVFLAGLSVFLKEKRYNAPLNEVRIFLIKRGLFFVVLEFTLISFLWNQIFPANIYSLNAQVIWAIGMSMIFLAAIKSLHPIWILLIGLLLVFGHNLLDQFHSTNSALWNLLHVRTTMTLTESLQITSFYPLMPWFGIISLGYVFGYFLFADSASLNKRKKIILSLAFSSLLLFVILRSYNLYGDKHLFAVGENFMVSAQSFLNVTKYPPSLLYFLITMPFGLIILAFNQESKFTQIIASYGKAPLFYYALHLILIVVIGKIIFFLSGGVYKSEHLIISWIVAVSLVISCYKPVLYFIAFRKNYGKRIGILSYI